LKFHKEAKASELPYSGTFAVGS